MGSFFLANLCGEVGEQGLFLVQFFFYCIGRLRKKIMDLNSLNMDSENALLYAVALIA
jgi:hypothetical protein